MRVTKATAVALMAAVAFLVATAAGASAVKIKQTELPEAVRAAADRHAPGARIRACWRIAGDAEPVYEVDVKADGRKKGFIFASDGKLLTIQEEVAWHDLPGGVQESLLRAARENEIEEVYSISQNGEITGYGARIDGEGVGIRDFHYQVGPRGEAFGGEEASRPRDAWRERAPTPNP
jgi:hypothetical protein